MNWIIILGTIALLATIAITAQRYFNSYLMSSLLTLTTLILTGLLYQYLASAYDDRNYSPPGKLYDVGGHRLHLDCRGEYTGKPAIILEAGSGDYSATWGLIQDELAKHTRVCSYDRAGFGWSDVSDHEHYPSQVAKELHSLLQVADIKPPYIMVGQSLGTLYVQTYTALYPHEVQGLVLVDPAHEELIERSKNNEILARAFVITTGQKLLFQIGKLFPSLARLYEKPFIEKYVPASLQQTYSEVMLSSKHLRSTIDDAFLGEKYYKEAQQYDGNLGDRPLIILGSTHFERPPKLSDAEYKTFLQLFRGMQEEIAQRSTQSRIIFVPDSGHMVQWDQPQVVIDNILILLK